MSRCQFFGGTVRFRGAEFSGGTVSFRGAEFSRGTVNFASAKFSGSAVNFYEAKFSGGAVRFIPTVFSGGEVNFSGAADWSFQPEFPWSGGGRPPPLCEAPKERRPIPDLGLPNPWPTLPRDAGYEHPAKARQPNG